MDESNTIKEFSYVGIGRIVTIALNAIFYLVLAALIEPEIFGQISVIVALASTFSIISLFGFSLSLQVYLAKNNLSVVEGIITLFIITTTAASLILLVMDQIAALLCASLSFYMMSQSYFLGKKQYKKFMIDSILKSVAFFILPLIFYFPFGISGIIFGMAISNFVGGLPFYRHLKIRNLVGVRKYFKVLLHNFGVNAGNFLPMAIDKLAIVSIFGFFIVGVYQFNLQVLIALSVLSGVLGQYLISEESRGKRHRKLSLLVVLVSVVVTIVAIVITPILVPIFYPKYVDGIQSLQIMLLAIIPKAIGTIFKSKQLARESTKIGYSAIVTIGTLLILIVFLGQLYGLIGLAIAVLATISANTLFFYILDRMSRQKTIL